MSLEVSIIMPAYNSAKYICDAIMSVQNQKTSLSTELIIVDDGSTDNTVAIIKDMQKRFPSIKLFVQANLKQSAARNKGLYHSKGKYIMFMDSDDIMLPGMIEKMHREIIHKKLVVCGIKKQFKAHATLEVESVLENTTEQDRMIAAYLTRNKEMDVGLWNKMFRRDILDDQRMENGNFFEDSLFVLDYLLKIKPQDIGFIHEPLYVLFKHSDTTTTCYNSDIDILSLSYMEKVKSRIQEKGTFDNRFFQVFVARTILHVIHHHIKYDNGWEPRKQISILRKNGLNYDIELNPWLKNKYKIAFFLAIFFPKLYIKLYRRNINA